MAIFIMLFHHLFYQQDSWGDYWWHLNHNGYPLIAFVAAQGKICVTIFVLLSGIGMAFSYKRRMEDVPSNRSEKIRISTKFVFEKIRKLYMLYWPIFITSLVLCAIVGIHTPQSVYSSVWQGVSDFFGVAYIFDRVTPFNGAWWYISFALLLYLFHPVIHKVTEKFPWISLAASFAIGIFPTSSIAIFIEIRRYLFVYILGILLAEKNWINKILDYERKRVLILATFGCVIFALIRVVWPFTFDAFLALSIIVFFTELSRTARRQWLWRGICYFGKHSGNIFLIHGVLYKYLLHDFIYGFYIPLFIWVMLLLLSLGCSVMIERGKKMCEGGFKKIDIGNKEL